MSGNELDFLSPFGVIERKPLTLVELRMRWFSGKIRAKPHWWNKIYDEEIVAKWRKEMTEHDAVMVERYWGGEERWKAGEGEKQWPRDRITDPQLNYILDELRYDASKYDAETGIFATAIHMIYESRSLIPTDVKASLVRGVSMLEDVPEEEKDWHPGSDKQVLNLVHPSMYCLHIGRSHVYCRDGSQSTPTVELTLEDYLASRSDLDNDSDDDDDSGNGNGHLNTVSERYQWLPTDFEISESGAVKPLAYINNLHPIHHRSLYVTISSVLSRFLPLFEKLLSDAVGSWPPAAVTPQPYEWYNHITVPEPDYQLWTTNPEAFDEFADEAYNDPFEAAMAKWVAKNQWPAIPEPQPFVPPPAQEQGEIKVSLRGRTVQVIVKLANIILTPENPKYPGGSWHVEGMQNESIVATGLYYYTCENITESRLDFRTAVGDEQQGLELEYQQDDTQGFLTAFGIQRDSPMNQYLGHIVAEQDKCIAFPNIYQHHVDAFELADPTKPGYRKILCFFVVDPFVRILSTSDVPPQQKHWALAELAQAPQLGILPRELYDIVLNYASDGLVSRKQAEDEREELMKERSQFVKLHNECLFEVGFNMCEH